MSNYPDNFNQQAFDRIYGETPEALNKHVAFLEDDLRDCERAICASMAVLASKAQRGSLPAKEDIEDLTHDMVTDLFANVICETEVELEEHRMAADTYVPPSVVRRRREHMRKFLNAAAVAAGFKPESTEA